MKKIMFNDKYGLTDAVLKGTKTQTRRNVKQQLIHDYYGLVCAYETGYIHSLHDSIEEFLLEHSTYKVGEVVAVAQRYSELGSASFDQWEKDLTWFEKGFSNKMFVRAELMPHQIKITNVRLQRLQEITDDECLLEGVKEVEKSNNWGNSATHTEYCVTYYDNKGLTKQLIGRNPKEAYAFLIDALSGKGTWDSNPYVYVYDFELTK